VTTIRSHRSDKKTVDNNNAIKIEMIIEPTMTAMSGITKTKNDKTSAVTIGQQ
jgi:hypothetical protein